MYISKMTIRNFRNFRNATFQFTEGVNTFIGENGSGKTNAFHAMRLLIDGTLPRTVKLSEADFNRSLPDGWRGHWIIIKIDFADLGESEGIQMLSHKVEAMDGSSTGSYTMYFRPNKSSRKKLYDLSILNADKEQLQEELNKIDIGDYEVVFTCRATAEFSDEGTYKKYVGDFEEVIFPSPDEEAQDILGVPSLKFSFHDEVSCTYIKALRDAEYELRNTRNNPLINLMKGIGKDIDGSSIVKSISDLNNEISNLDPIKEMRDRVRSTLQSTVGVTYAPSIDIRSQLPDDLEKLFKSLTLWVGDSEDEGYQGQVGELSLGGANLIYISLKLLEYELKQSQEKAGHFLLIEEPESHIHTHIQKTLFEKYGYRNTQVIISTHSTHISAASQIRSVNVLAKRAGEAVVFSPSKGLDGDACSKIERYLDAIRSTLLFAKGVMLVEGDAELILIPTMFKQVFNLSLDEVGISLINMGSTVFKHIATLFHEDRIQRKCAILTDMDTSIVPLDPDPEKDDKYSHDCRNSQKDGFRRKKELDLFCETNRWVKPYYATYTFEVDFVISGNSWEVTRVLPDIYKLEQYIDDSSEKLGKETPEIAGKEVLHLAKKEGKGWFALQISEHVNYRTNIPEYILDAIAFTCDNFTESHFELIADYRIDLGAEDANNVDRDIFKSLKSKKDILVEESIKSGQSYVQEFIDIYKNDLPNDQLTKLLSFMGK